MKQTIIGAAAIVTAVGVLVAALDQFGARPVVSRELEEVRADLEVVANGVNYIRWQELDRKAQAGTLTTRERVEYCALSEQLGLKGIGCA